MLRFSNRFCIPLALASALLASCGAPGRNGDLDLEHSFLAALDGFADVRAVDGYANENFQASFDDAFAQFASSPTGDDGRHNFDVLVLSSGGVNGAFGAGILTGWTESGNRPDFRLITGVSVGALMAPFAFAGSDFDDRLERLFRSISPDDLHDDSGFIQGAIWGESLLDNSALIERIARAVDLTLLDAVAHEHSLGRRCYVGSTNLDSGQFVIWDLGAIASRGTIEALHLFRRVLQASASIPVVYPPVRFGEGDKDELHVDGAVMHPMFLPQGVFDARRSAALAGVDEADVNTTMYVVHNGSLLPRPTRVDRSTLDIAAQAVNLMTYTMVAEDILHLFVISQVWNARFQFLTLPAELELSVTDFTPADTEALFQHGHDMIMSDWPWIETPPGYIVNDNLHRITPRVELEDESQDVIERLEQLEAELILLRAALSNE